MAALFADLPAAVAGAADLADRLDFTLADLGYRFPDATAPAGRDPVVVAAADDVERGAGALPAAHRAGAGRSSSSELDLIEKLDLAGYFLDRLGHRRVLQAGEDPRPGARLGRQQRRLLRALHHRRRPGEDGAPLRALPLGGAGRVARHRPRPPLGRPAREKVIQHVYATYGVARRGDDGEHHHLPRPLRGARDGQGARLLDRAGRHARQAARDVELRGVPGRGRVAHGAGDGRRGSEGGRRGPRRRFRRRRRQRLRPSPRRWPTRCAPPASTPTTSALRHFGSALPPHPEPPAPPRPALGRDGRRGRAARRGRPARAGRDAGARRHPVGQGRLRRPRHHQGRPPRPRDARRHRRDDPDDPRRPKGSTSTSRTCRTTTRPSTRS